MSSEDKNYYGVGGTKMYSLVGPLDILKTIYTLSHPYLQLGQNHSFKDLKLGLRKHLLKIQPDIPRSSEIDPEFISTGERMKPLLDILLLEEERRSEHVLEASKREDVFQKVVRGFHKLCETEVQLSDIFRVVTDTVLVTTDIKTSGSATTNTAVGITWIQPDDWWTEQDIIEALIHELTHTLLFLDEQRYGHYNSFDYLYDQSTWVPSAIRNELRPVNGVVHSIIVATEILSLREKLGYLDAKLELHGNSIEIFNKTKNALDTLQKRSASWDLLSPRMQFLLNASDRLLCSLHQNFTGGQEHVSGL